MAKNTLPKPQPKRPPQKPAIHPDAQDIIIHARQELGGVINQIESLNGLLFHVDEGNKELYDWSFALSTVIDVIAKQAWHTHKVLGVAYGAVPETDLSRLPWKEEGGAR